MLDIFYAVSIIIFVNISQFVEGHFVFSNFQDSREFCCMYSEHSIVFVQIQVTVFAWNSNVEYPLHIIYPKPHNRPKCITDDGGIRQN